MKSLLIQGFRRNFGRNTYIQFMMDSYGQKSSQCRAGTED